MRERAENQGFRRERRQNEGGGNSPGRMRKVRGTCLWGLAPEMAEAGKSHGKPACPPKELGASKASYASTIIGVLVHLLREARYQRP